MKTPIVSVFTALLFGLFITATASELQTQSFSVVEAYGYSTRCPDKTIAVLYREALADALRNAVIQAHTEIVIEACTENMQLKTQTIHTRSRGYVKSSSSLDSGFLPDNPSIYRVHIKAIILPPPSVKMKDRKELIAGTNSASFFSCSNKQRRPEITQQLQQPALQPSIYKNSGNRKIDDTASQTNGEKKEK